MSNPMPPMLKAATRTAAILFGFALVGTAMLALVFGLTHKIIERNEEMAKLELVAQTLPHGSYDNDIIRDEIKLPAEKLLGTEDTSLAYRAKLQGKFTAVVLEAVAPDGYSGKINLLVGIRADGVITGVRVVAHRETPGLGDYIEIAKSAWIKQFDGHTTDSPGEKGWRVKKDGGYFDSVSGATITPRAVVKAVHKALLYFKEHKDSLLEPAPATNRKRED